MAQPHRHRAIGSRGRLAATVVVGALVAGGLSAALGAGYSVARSALDNGSAFVAKGTGLAHVNSQSQQVDAETAGDLSSGKELVDVVTFPDGHVVVVNDHTGVVTSVDPTTMKTTATINPLPVSNAADVTAAHGDVRVISSGQAGWLAGLTGGFVEQIGQRGPSGRVLQLGAPLADVAPGPDGSVIAVTTSGIVIRVGTDMVAHRTTIAGGAGAALTVAGGHTFLITAAGEVLGVDGDHPTTLAKPAVLSGTVLAGSIEGAGSHVLAVSHDLLLLIDAGNGDTKSVALNSGSSSLGRPVEMDGRVYVPDYAKHRLIVVDEKHLTLAKSVAVPGSTKTFALFVSGARVWANDQFSQMMLSIDANGHDRNIDKGTGKGIDDTAGAPKPTPPTSPTTPPPAPRPGLPALPPLPAFNPHPPNSTAPHPGTGPVTPRPARPTPARPTPATPTGPAPAKMVAVPSFPAHTDYHDACTQLQSRGLGCLQVAVDAQGQSGNTNDVVATRPGAGTQVAVGSQVVVTYLGQLAVPDGLVGQNPDDACAAVLAGELKCQLQPAATPAATPQEFGIVNAVNPAPGTKLDKGSTVTVTYPDTFTMPNFTNAAGDASCTQLAGYQVTVNGTTSKPTCTPQVGTTAPTLAQAGQVYLQEPAVAATVTANAAIILHVYNGKQQVKDWSNVPIDQALSECSATPGLTCSAVAGDSAANQPQKANTVESQNPGPGQVDVGTTVTLTQWRGDNAVPNVTGMSKDAACAAISAAGFACGDSPGLVSPTANVVVAQDQPAGSTQALGTPVAYHYSPLQAEVVSIYRADNGDPVWTMGFSAPAGYGSQTFRVGLAYRPGSPGDLNSVNDYYCTGGVSRCGGFAKNHFSSQLGSTYTASNGVTWGGPGAVASFMKSCPAGSQHIYRYWMFSGSVRQYNISGAVPAGSTGSEDLGCVWP